MIKIWVVEYQHLPDASKVKSAEYGYCPIGFSNVAAQVKWFQRRWAIRTKLESISSSDFKLQLEPFQKPKVKDNEGNIVYYISLSHTPSHFAFALSENIDLGIDIEMLQPIFLSQEMLDLTCHPEEFHNFDSLSSTSPNIPFYKIWTTKEAFLKLKGVGLTENLHDLKVSAIKDCHAICHWLTDRMIITVCHQKMEQEYAINFTVEDDWK